MAGSLVFMNKPLVCRTVDNGCSCSIGCYRTIFVARLNCFDYVLYGGAHHAAAGGIAVVMFLRLTGTLAGLL